MTAPAPRKDYPRAWSLPLIATSRRIDLFAAVLFAVALVVATVIAVWSEVTVVVEIEDVTDEGGAP